MKKARNIAKKIKKIEQTAARVANAAKKIEKFSSAPMASLGGAVGARLGSRRTGNSVGRFLGKITGTGDYRVAVNSIANSSATMALDTVPQFMKRNSRETRVTHREYLGKIVASEQAGEFKLQSFPLNPGLFETFPWLSQIANQFDEWRPNGIVVVYKSASSSFSGTSSLGIITMATDYDVLDPQYSNTIEMNNSDFAVSTNVAQNLIHPVECAVKERPTRLLYTRSGPIATNDNLRWYDLGNFQVATEGCTAGQVCGELWITYDVSFFKAQINSTPLNINPIGLYGFAQAGIDATNPFGTSQDYASNSTLPVDITGDRLIIDNGTGLYTNRCFLFIATWTAVTQYSSINVPGPNPLSHGPGLEFLDISPIGTTFSTTSSGTANVVTASCCVGVKVTAITGAWFDLNVTLAGSATDHMAFTMVQIPDLVPVL